LKLLAIAVALERSFVDGALVGIARHRHLAIRDLLQHLVRWKVLDHFLRIHLQSAEGSKARVESAVVYFFGMKLEFDPFVDAHGCDFLLVTGARANGGAMECV